MIKFIAHTLVGLSLVTLLAGCGHSSLEGRVNLLPNPPIKETETSSPSRDYIDFDTISDLTIDSKLYYSEKYLELISRIKTRISVTSYDSFEEKAFEYLRLGHAAWAQANKTGDKGRATEAKQYFSTATSGGKLAENKDIECSAILAQFAVDFYVREDYSDKNMPLLLMIAKENLLIKEHLFGCSERDFTYFPDFKKVFP